MKSIFDDQEKHLKDLFLKSLAGDKIVYHQFLQLLTRHLRAFIGRRLSNTPNDIEDLVQETLIAIHEKRHTYNPDYPLTSWVHAIAKYKMIDAFRASKDHLSDEYDDDMGFTATSETDQFEINKDLHHLLNRLPDHHRLPIVHVKIQGLSITETAELLKMSESAVKVGIHRGLQLLISKNARI